MGGATIHNPLSGQTLTFLATGRDTGGEVLAAEVHLAPGGRVPRHAHLRTDERVEVLEGAVTIRIGRREQTLGPGESVDVPRRKAHVLRNAGDGDARFHLEVRPARRTETLMRAVFAVSRMRARVLRR